MLLAGAVGAGYGFLMDSKSESVSFIGAAGFLAAVAVGIVPEVKLIKRLRRMTENTVTV